jgi:UPF0755 protein
MNRLIRLGAALFALFSLCTLVSGIGLFVLSGGSPLRFVQTEWLRLNLAAREAELNQPFGADSTPRRFEVAQGDNARAIAARLVAAGLIADADLFVDYVRVNGIDTRIQASTYFLAQTQSTTEIAQALTDPRSTQFPFRILEGWRMEEIAATIDGTVYFPFTGADFLRAVGPGAAVSETFRAYVGLPDGASLEGFLFPDTYQLPAAITPEMLRDLLTEQFMARVTPSMREAAAVQGLTLYQAVTLASIIQREAVHADEHPMISSVYTNRMRIGMKLDADPTVQYGIGFRGGRWWPAITIADYTNAVHPYNTYLNTGLPPGPIASPGLTAIEAAISPAVSDFYFFRAECSGSGYHRFARTFEEHLANACP